MISLSLSVVVVVVVVEYVVFVAVLVCCYCYRIDSFVCSACRKLQHCIEAKSVAASVDDQLAPFSCASVNRVCFGFMCDLAAEVNYCIVFRQL